MERFDEQEAFNKAGEMGSNATEEDIANVAKKMDSMNRGPLEKIWDKVELLWDKFRSPETSKLDKTLIIGGLIYMVSPLDLVPDPIPVFGLMDDVSVLLAVFSRVMVCGVAAVGIAHIDVEWLKNKLVKPDMAEELEKTKQAKKLPKSLKDKMEEAPTITLDDSETQDMYPGAVREAANTCIARVTRVTPNSVTLSIWDSSGTTLLVSDIEYTGKVDAEIQEGDEIIYNI